MNTRSPQLHNLIPHRLIPRKAELLLAVIPEVLPRHLTHLHPVRPHNRTSRPVLHYHVVAHIIEVVLVIAIPIGRLEPLIHLQVEHQKPQTVRRHSLLFGQRQTRNKIARLQANISFRRQLRNNSLVGKQYDRRSLSDCKHRPSNS
jgi:hypothetical protein